MGHKLVSTAPAADGLVEQVMALGLWPHDHGLLVYPNTVLNAEAGLTLWRGHEARRSTFGALWDDDFDWSAAILIDESVGDRAATLPGIFTWLFGHELGHAITAMRDWKAFSCQIFVQGRIRGASGEKISTWLDVPFEESLDGFGVHVAARLGLHGALIEEIAAGGHSNLRLDADRVERLVGLDPVDALPDPRRELRDFAAPYRASLRELWDLGLAEEGDDFVGTGVSFDEIL